MKYKIGDNVLVKAEIADITNSEPEYYVKTEWGVNKRIYEHEIYPIEKTYNDGINDAWEVAKKLANMDIKYIEELFAEWDFTEIMNNHTFAEIAEKIRKWEDAREIHVGDVVKLDNGAIGAVISQVYKNAYCIIDSNAMIKTYDVDEFTKLKRSVDIKGLLKQIGGADEN